jgi:hypothetical protein
MNTSQRSGCVTAALILGGAIIAAAVLAAAAVFGLGQAVNDALDGLRPSRVVQTALPLGTPTIVVRPPAVLQVRALSDLATAQTTMSTVVEVEKARVGTVVYERLVLIACGRVRAGVDLSKLRDDDVRVDGDVIHVRLPQAVLQDAYLIDDEGKACTTRVFDRTNLVLLPESKELEGQARARALQAIRDTAIESGLLIDAERNARTAIERVLLLAGYREVRFLER